MIYGISPTLLSSEELAQVPEKHRHAVCDRIGLLRDWMERQASGMSGRRAAESMSLSQPTLCRWARLYHTHGFTGLIPQTAKCGRRSSRSPQGLAA